MEGIIFIGVQASGKSTFYLQRYFKTHIRLNMDMLKTRHRENLLLKALIEAKQPLVIDNTNPAVSDRARYIIPLKQAGFQITGYYFQSNILECLGRNDRREGKEHIPEIGIKCTYNKMVLPSYAEGFDKLFYVSLTTDGFTTEGWQA